MSILHPMNFRIPSCFIPLLAVIALLFSPTLSAVEGAAKEQSIDTIVEDLKQIELRLQEETFTRDDLGVWTKAVKGAEEYCDSLYHRQVKTRLKKLEENLATLGQTVKDEAPDVTRQREEFRQRKAELDKRLTQCRVLKIRSDKLDDSIGEKGKADPGRGSCSPKDRVRFTCCSGNSGLLPTGSPGSRSLLPNRVVLICSVPHSGRWEFSRCSLSWGSAAHCINA